MVTARFGLRERAAGAANIAAMQLYEPQRHERLGGADWSEARARAAIEQIVADTQRGFSVDGLWPLHPFDVSPERPSGVEAAVLRCGRRDLGARSSGATRRRRAGRRLSADRAANSASAITPTCASNAEVNAYMGPAVGVVSGRRRRHADAAVEAHARSDARRTHPSRAARQRRRQPRPAVGRGGIDGRGGPDAAS